MTSGVVEVWRDRNILQLLVRRDLAVKYQQSVLGYLWSLLEPLTIAATYWFVFGVVYNTRTADEGMEYVLYLVSGLFAWIWFNSCISESTGALTSQSRLIQTIKVPREIFPIGRVFGKFFEFLAALPVLVVAAIIYSGSFGINLLALPVAIVFEGVLLIGLSLFFASANVLLRDVERFIRLGLRVMFYLVPVIYPLSKVQQADSIPHWVKVIYELNPLVGILEIYHTAWRTGPWPDSKLMLTAAVGSLVFLLAGWWSFHQLEPAVLKEL